MQLYNPKAGFYWLAGTIIMIIVMAVNGHPLKNPATPLGIINLELANTAVKVHDILTVWSNDISKPVDLQARAFQNTCLDFIFIFFYTGLLWYCCKKMQSYFQAQNLLNKIAGLLAYCPIVAGLFDVLENTGMFFSLGGHVNDPIAFFTAASSAIKWLLLTATIFLLLLFFAFKQLRIRYK